MSRLRHLAAGGQHLLFNSTHVSSLPDPQPTPNPPPLTPRAALGVCAFFTLASAAFTWPLVLRLGDSLPDWGDPADSAWRLGAIARQLSHDPLHLYQTTAFYPLHNGLALDELLTGQGLLGAPLIWLSGSPPL